METINQSLETRRVRGHQPAHGSINTEARMTRVETTIGHIVKDLTEIKLDIRQLRNYVDERFREFELKVDERFRQFEAKVDERFRHFEARVDERFLRFEARVDERFLRFESSMRTEFRLVWAGMFAIVGLLAKGFHWI